MRLYGVLQQRSTAEVVLSLAEHVAELLKGTGRSEEVEISRNITFSEKIHTDSWCI